MKPWIKLSIVVLISSCSAVFADIDISQFDLPFIHARKQIKRSYTEDLAKDPPASPPPIIEAKQHPKPRVMLAQTPSEHSNDAEQIIAIETPIILPQPVKVSEEPKVNLDKAVVTANVWVELHKTEVGLKLTECDRLIDEKYPNPPLRLECISKDEGTRYYAKSNRTARDGAYLWNYQTVTWQN
jgi:hypothetical protein